MALVMLQERISSRPGNVLRPAGRPEWNRMDAQVFDIIAKIVSTLEEGKLGRGAVLIEWLPIVDTYITLSVSRRHPQSEQY